MASIPTTWLKGLSKEDKETFEAFMRSSFNHKVLKRFREVLDEMYLQYEDNRQDYTDASWPYRQADACGCKRTIRDIRKLFDFL